MNVTKQELTNRINLFIKHMNQANPGWDTAFFMSHVNQYYFMGTMQDALLCIKSTGDISYFARRSFDRAKDESPLSELIYPMKSYRDAVDIIGADCGNVFFETEVVTYAILQRMQKYLNFDSINSLDKIISMQRAVKSDYELQCLKQAGRLHHDYLNNVVPDLFYEGMSEAELCGKLYETMLRHGHDGTARFSMFQNEIGIGQIGFGVSSLYPTSFDGPAGSKGLSAAVPFVGNRDIKLKPGDLILVDCAFNVEGYQSDKTQMYYFKAKVPESAKKVHRKCMEIEELAASMLRPGAVPSDIYDTIQNGLDPKFADGFMGYQNRTVKFLGHGVGLYIDEMPVIAKGFSMPLQKNMTIALEPKKGLQEIGLVGVEDTFLVTDNGGECITGHCSEIIEI